MSEGTETNRSEVGNQGGGTAFVGEQLPKAMGSGDMCRAFSISHPTFKKRERAGAFRPFELPRAIGAKRYSGEKVQLFLNGRQ